MPNSGKELADRAEALVDEAYSLRTAGRPRDALALCAEAERILTGVTSDEALAVLLDALNESALSWSQLGDLGEERRLQEMVISRAGVSTDPEVVLQRHTAEQNIALTLLREKRPAEVFALLNDDFMEWWPPVTDERAAEIFLRGLRFSAEALVLVGELEGAVEVLDGGLALYDASPEPAVRHELMRCCESKADTLSMAGTYDAAIAAYDEQLERIGDATDVASIRAAARGLVHRAYCREMAGDVESADADRREIVRRYAEIDDSAVQEMVGVAREVLGGE